jgi:hypothetical protein
MTPITHALADRVGDLLQPVHRGVIWIAESRRFLVFGNDGYRDPRTCRVVVAMLERLPAAGHRAEQLLVCSANYTWVLVLAPDDARRDAESDREALTELLWEVWQESLNLGSTAPEAGGYQRALADLELREIGGGYTDATLDHPINPKAGIVRGDILEKRMRLPKEDDLTDPERGHLLLAGVPYPAWLGTVELVGDFAPGLEAVILAEDVGDPRAASRDAVSGFFRAGSLFFARDTGQPHPSTGFRVLAPENPHTGSRRAG